MDRLLHSLLSLSSPTSEENAIHSALSTYLHDIGDIEIDSMQNFTCTINPHLPCSIMLNAHSDEVGLQVMFIDANGFIYCRRNGFIDGITLPGSTVTVLDDRGSITGVIGKRPIHFPSENDQISIKVEDLWIDCGFESQAEAEQHVRIGDCVVFSSNIREERNKIISKGLDDKIGCYVISKAIKQLSNLNLQSNICACYSSQEEVGGRGSKVAATRINPSWAICVDVGIATDIPSLSEQKYGSITLGKGPVLNINCDNNKELYNILLNVATKNNIPIQQYCTPSSTGGSDASIIQLCNSGIKTCLISIPCRYSHTPIEMCDLRDVEKTTELIVKTVIELDSRQKLKII